MYNTQKPCSCKGCGKGGQLAGLTYPDLAFPVPELNVDPIVNMPLRTAGGGVSVDGLVKQYWPLALIAVGAVLLLAGDN